MDPFLLSRIQFGANISFHILFPTISIALAWVLAVFKLQLWRTGDRKWMDAYMFWVKIFALTFALGVVTGITMSFQFGTNWPGFMEKVGNVAGPLLAYEVLTAFFLEAVFLGIMLFGARRVAPWVHNTATLLVAFGTTMSAFWIIALNSWMQTPVGFEIRDGVVHATDWLAIVFNPSMPYRLTHMLLASGLTVAFLIAGVSAYRRLRGDKTAASAATLRLGLWMAAILIPIQIFAGDAHGLNTLEHQPQKVAAMEANWSTGTDVPMVLFALPDETLRENRYELALPGLASLILTHSWNGEVPGLNDFVAADGTPMHPPVAPVFFAFRIMVGMGFFMLAVAWGGVALIWKRGAENLPRPFLYLSLGMTFAGWIATLAGWYTTEIGRQPWLVTGVLTTKEAVGPIAGGMVLGTLLMYLALYAVLLVAYITVIFQLARKAAKGEVQPEPIRSPAQALTTAKPVQPAE